MKIGAGPNEWRFDRENLAIPQQADDQVSYYVKATPKKVAAYEAAKLVTDFDPKNRDENVDYYVAKLDDLVKKFGGVISPSSTAEQESLAF